MKTAAASGMVTGKLHLSPATTSNPAITASKRLRIVPPRIMGIQSLLLVALVGGGIRQLVRRRRSSAAEM